MISKFKQGSDDYLIDTTDLIIGKLVHEKTHLFKAYNYYLGFRDKYLFQHLEQNYGVGNPTSIKFTPLIRKHIDAIVGEYLTTKILPKISCKDRKTLTNIMRDKQLEVSKLMKEYVSKFLENSLYEALAGKPQLDLKVVDPVIDLELKNILEAVDLNFISNYEIAAQDIILYALLSRRIDFKSNLLQILLDLLIAGEAYYKVIPTVSKKNFKLEVTDPINTFVFKNPHSKYMKDGTMSVVRKWLTREEIGIKYGKDLSDEDIKSLESFAGYTNDDERLTWIAAVNSRGDARTRGILLGVEVSNYFDDDFHTDVELIPIYEVEWIDYNRNENRGVLYYVTRIGGDIYILHGENEYISRTQDDPEAARLQINGIYYTTRTGVPYSLMLATADLLDLYDLSIFQKDNLIALSGVKGAIINMAELPNWLGSTPQERLEKFLGYRKMGAALIDTSLDGQLAPNTIYNGFDDTLPINAILGYLLSIQMIEDIASLITGVFRERLGGILQRDAVANVEMGMQQSYIITKLYYQAMDVLVAEMLVDILDMAKIVYKKGFTGECILGDKQQIFTLLPEHYSFTDYDIHLADSAEIIKEMETLKLLAIQLSSLNQVDPEILIDVVTSKSYTDMNEKVRKTIHDKKLENNQIQQLSQQLEEAQNNIQQMQKLLEESTRKITQLNEKKLNMEHADRVTDQNIEWYKVRKAAEAKDKEMELIKERNKIESAELLDNNLRNDEVQNDKY